MTAPFAAAAPPAAPSTATTAPAAAAIPEAELVAFAGEIEQAVARGDVAFMLERFDVDAIVETVTANVAAPPAVRRGFADGLHGRQGGGRPLPAQLVADVSGGGTYKFLHVARDGAGGDDAAPAPAAAPLFRLQPASGGVNYHKLRVRRRPRDGRLVVVDIYVALTGEDLTQTLRRSYIPIALQAAGPATPQTKAALDGYALFGDMAKARRDGDHAQVLALYARLPDALKREKMAALFRLMSAAFLDDPAAYEAAIADVGPLLKGDVAPDLVAIDAALIKDRHDEALAAVDRVDKWVGGAGDPYLDVMRATVVLDANRPAEARRFAARAVEREPTSHAAHDMLLTLAVREKDHAETARLLGIFETQFGLSFGDLTDVPDFKDFVGTPEYRRWMARGGAAAPK